MTHDYRKLSQSGIELPKIALGSSSFGSTIGEKESFKILDHYLDCGLNFIDAGNEGSVSEILTAKWMKQSKKRSKLLLAAQVGSLPRKGSKTSSKKLILQAVDESLSRLKIEYIDLCQSHFDNLGVPLEESLETLHLLVSTGKVRFIGTCGSTPERLRASLDVSRRRSWAEYSSARVEYNLCERDKFESGLSEVCLGENVTLLTSSSLAGGFLSGKYRWSLDTYGKSRKSTVQRYLNQRGIKLLCALDVISEKHSASPAQIALAWLMSQPGTLLPVVNTSSVEQLSELLESLTLKLDRSDLNNLNQVSRVSIAAK